MAGNFGASGQTQAWRWNLDYVVDVHGNTMTLFYGKEEGAYAREYNPNLRTTYDRGGYLARIEYGTRKGSEHTATVPARVVFDVLDRCLPGSPCTTTDAASWTDTPWDQYCAAAPCTTQASPTFWTQKRLAKVRTQVWRGTQHSDVESWTLRHEYLDAGAADGEGVPMWLAGITHTGHVTTAGGIEVSDPEIVFDPGTAPLANRVDGPEDGKTHLNRFRIQRLYTESGNIVTIVYSPTECTRDAAPEPQTNGKRCYPQWYGPNGMEESLDWFHKYVVDEVIVDDNTGASARMHTFYDYLDSPAWHYDDSEMTKPERRTWSQFRGYSKVRIRQGEQSGPQTSTDFLYLRGMNGDRATPEGGTKSVSVTDSQGVSIVDHEAHSGFLRETINTNGVGGAVVTGSINDPWQHGPTATAGEQKAWLTNTSTTRSRTALEGGGTRWTKSTVSFDTTYGLATQIEDLGDESTSDDDRCVRYTYARNTSPEIYLVGKVVRKETVTVNCSTVPLRPQHVLADSRVFFDNPDTFAATPTRGLVRKTEELDSWNGTTPVYAMTARFTYDQHGRVLEAFDELNHRTGFGYFPLTGGPVTANSVTNALNHTTTTTVERAWGQAVTTVDPNGFKNELVYDGLGRVKAAWTPGRDKATQTANVTFDYLIRKTAPSAVTTRTLLTLGASYTTSVSLFDGSLRARQTQSQAPGGGRTISDTFYDSRGQIVKQSKEYYDVSNAGPDTTLVGPAGQQQIPGILEYAYDGAGRPTAEIFKALGQEKWRSTTTYGGDRVHVTPPQGGVATTSISDARGRTTALREYHGPAPVGTYDQTMYGHNDRGDLTSVVDPAGITWSWEYDLRGRLTTATDPDTGATTLTYDEAGRTKTSTDAEDNVLAYTYDELGRKTSLRDGSTTGPLRAQWVYDTLPNGIGALTRSIRHEGDDQYTTEVVGYDNAGRPTGSRVIIPNNETGLTGIYDTGVTYWADGSLSRVDLPAIGGLAAEGLVHSYNDVGQQTEINGLAIYVYSATYDKLGELTQRVLGPFGKRTSTTFAVDEPSGRLTGMSVLPENQNEVVDLAYSYDPAGNLKRIADSPGAVLPNDTQCFRYDHKRRLTQAWTPSAKTETNCDPNPQLLGGAAKYRQDFTYDLSGNRKTLTEYTSSVPASTTTYAYPTPASARPHTVDSTTTVAGGVTSQDTFQYDASGNTTRRVVGGNTQDLTWDAEGNVKETEDATGETKYIYDADGNRLIRRDPSGKTLYLPSQELRYSGGAATATRYYSHQGTQIAVRTSTSLTWTVTDHHNTGEVMIRDSDQQVQRRRTKPFGETRGTAPAWWAGDKGFLGGTQDPNGLTHLGARLYDPKLGRFISADPIMDLTDPQQMNGYAYAHNNPASFSDPSGLADCADLNCNQVAYKQPDGSYVITGTPVDETAPCAPNCKVGGGGPEEPTVDPAVIAAQQAAERAKQQLINAAKELLQIAMDELGITAALDCFTTGDLGSCAETALNVASAFVGGVAGKMLAKYGAPWKWKKGAELVSRIWGALKRIVTGVKEWFENTRLAQRLAKASGCNSFVPGTLVLMGDGTSKPIEDVDIGDTVIATDPETGETAEEVVSATIIGHGTKNLVQITIDMDGGGGEATDTIIATERHPFWAPDLGEWLDATSLRAGGWLQTSSGTWVQIAAIERWTQIATVHNLTVTDIHTYYVVAGHAPVLVHNTGPNPNPKPLISMEDALDRAVAHVGDNPRSVTSSSGGVQFMNDEIDQNGRKVTRIARFDVNPNSAHIQATGPHLNLETQVNGKTVTSGPLKGPHHMIDPSTIRSGDYC